MGKGQALDIRESPHPSEDSLPNPLAPSPKESCGRDPGGGGATRATPPSVHKAYCGHPAVCVHALCVCMCVHVRGGKCGGNTDPGPCPQKAQSLSLEMQILLECQRFLYATRDRGILDLAICPFLQSLPTPLLPTHHPPVPHPTWGHAGGLQADKPGLPISTSQPGTGTEHRLPAHSCVWENIILEELFL